MENDTPHPEYDQKNHFGVLTYIILGTGGWKAQGKIDRLMIPGVIDGRFAERETTI
jgi:hypothetical protein